MKSICLIAFSVMLAGGLLLAGCTSTSPPVQTPASVPATAAVIPSPTPTAVPTAVPYPEALALGGFATFGKGNEQGKATVYRYEVRPNYNWTSPTWNSPREQGAASQPLDLQRGYTTEKPRDGNTFLFLYVRVVNTGTNDVYAPSAKQFVVFSNGEMYRYTSVHGSDVVIDKITGTHYDYQIGRGGTVGYIQPGESNQAEGYLIYEIPAPFIPATTYVVSNLDYQNQAVWKLG